MEIRGCSPVKASSLRGYCGTLGKELGSFKWMTIGLAVVDLPGVEVSHTSSGIWWRIWGGTLARVGFVVAVKAIFTGVNDKVALCFVKRSRPNRGVGQAGRTRKECVNRVFSREQGKGGVKWP